MSKYLHCGKWNKNNKYIFLTALFAFFTNWIYGYTFNDSLNEIKIFQILKDKKENNHIIINYLFRYFGLILFSLALYEYELYNRNKIFEKNSKDNILKSSSLRLIYNNSEENTKNKIIISPLFILLIMIIMVLQEISEDIFYKSILRSLDFWMLELPLLSYLNSKYFKIKIYLHHTLVIYLNLIICGISKIIALIIFIYKGKEGSVIELYKKNWGVIPLGIITYLIIMTSRAFALNEIKVLMEYKYISPIKLLIIYGIIGVIITTIIGTISTFIECNNINSFLEICKILDTNKVAYLENFKIWSIDIYKNNIIFELFFLLIGIITNFLYRLFYILIIKNLNTIHIIFSNLIYTSLLIWIGAAKIFNEDNTQKNFPVFKVIVNLIVIFGILLYLEMIELNFCNLNYNIKKAIIDRSIEDYELKSDYDEEQIINLNDSIFI